MSQRIADHLWLHPFHPSRLVKGLVVKEIIPLLVTCFHSSLSTKKADTIASYVFYTKGGQGKRV